MNAIITLLVVQTLWMIWRDLDFRKHRVELQNVERSYQQNQQILHENYRSAKEEAIHYRALHAQLKSMPPYPILPPAKRTQTKGSKKR